jgi:hypothetical protein
MIMGAKSAGKPANANFGVFDFHCYTFTLISTGISIIMNHTGDYPGTPDCFPDE